MDVVKHSNECPAIMIMEGMRCRHGTEGPDSRSKTILVSNRIEININARAGDQSVTTQHGPWAVKLERNEKIHMHNPSFVFPA